LGGFLQQTGEHPKSLPYFERALAMLQRLYPPERYRNGHPNLANTLNNLGMALSALGQDGKALEYFQKALAMRERLYPPDPFPNGHPDLAKNLNNLGATKRGLGEYGEALSYHKKALAMHERLYPPDKFPDGYRDLAQSFDNLGAVLEATAEYGEALSFYQKALAMWERLYPPDRFKDGHPSLAVNLGKVGHLLQAMGEPAKALPYLKRGLDMQTRQAVRETAGAPEMQALALLHQRLPLARGLYLSTALQVPSEAVSEAYATAWPSKGLFLRLVARRHQAVLLTASASPEAGRDWTRLQEIRRQLNRLAVGLVKDVATRDHRMAELTDEQELLERRLAKQFPELDRHRRLAPLGPADLSRQLEPGTAFIDLLRLRFEKGGRFAGDRYQAFVLAPDRPDSRVDLGAAPPIDAAIDSWRRSIANQEASLAPAKLKELVWDKLASVLPAGTKVVYLCPEGNLARLPWAALPGSKPGTVLLEECALAVVPSGSWLLEQLLYPPKGGSGPDLLLAAGSIEYGTPPSGTRSQYRPLAGTGLELARVLEAFGAGDEAALRRTNATPEALRERLPKAHYVHLATHGYFDAPALTAEWKRAQEQMERWQFREDEATLPVGLAARNSLGYVGLALAGANDPETAGPDGGILTGLGIVDLRLEGLRLCVLSACETGLGELTEGEGVVGLQRAFHVAGCPNVIGSLWRVDDAATAALMAQFYHELRMNKRLPLEALRRAQLTIFRHPERILALAGERGKPAQEAAAKLGPAAAPPTEPGGKAPPRLWAAFTLSGIGR
jgi:CHAT domain-containing protein